MIFNHAAYDSNRTVLYTATLNKTGKAQLNGIGHWSLVICYLSLAATGFERLRRFSPYPERVCLSALSGEEGNGTTMGEWNVGQGTRSMGFRAGLGVGAGFIFALVSLTVLGEDKPDEKAKEPAATSAEITDPLYLLELARVHLNYNALDRAEPLLRKALQVATKDDVKYQVHQVLATLLQRKPDLKEAAQELNTALQTAPEGDRARLVFMLADISEQAKDYATAEKKLQEVAAASKAGVGADGKEDPMKGWARTESLRRLVRIWQAQPGRIDKVIEEAEQALAKDPKDEGELQKLIAIYSNGLGDPAKAATAYERMLALHPDKDLIRGLAALYARTNQPEKAAELYGKLIASSPEPEARQYAYQAASSLLQGGKKEKAVEMYKQFAANITTLPELIQAGSFYEQAGALDEVEKIYKKAEALTTTLQEKTDLRLKLAEMYNNQKQADKAESLIRDVRKDCKDDKALMAKANSALIRLYESQNRLGELKLGD